MKGSEVIVVIVEEALFSAAVAVLAECRKPGFLWQLQRAAGTEGGVAQTGRWSGHQSRADGCTVASCDCCDCCDCLTKMFSACSLSRQARDRFLAGIGEEAEQAWQQPRAKVDQWILCHQYDAR
jgi:hypothetical protein